MFVSPSNILLAGLSESVPSIPYSPNPSNCFAIYISIVFEEVFPLESEKVIWFSNFLTPLKSIKERSSIVFLLPLFKEDTSTNSKSGEPFVSVVLNVYVIWSVCKSLISNEATVRDCVKDVLKIRLPCPIFWLLILSITDITGVSSTAPKILSSLILLFGYEAEPGVFSI